MQNAPRRAIIARNEVAEILTEEELNSARNILSRIRDEERHLNSLRDAAQNITAVIDGMPKSRSQTSKVEKVTLLIVEVERELEKLRPQLDEAAANIANKITATSLSPYEKQILILRYVGCLSWRQVQYKTQSAESRVFYLHKSAMEKLKLESQ